MTSLCVWQNLFTCSITCWYVCDMIKTHVCHNLFKCDDPHSQNATTLLHVYTKTRDFSFAHAQTQWNFRSGPSKHPPFPFFFFLFLVLFLFLFLRVCAHTHSLSLSQSLSYTLSQMYAQNFTRWLILQVHRSLVIISHIQRGHLTYDNECRMNVEWMYSWMYLICIGAG